MATQIDSLTKQQMKERIELLERRVQALERLLASQTRKRDWRGTFGMFANDDEFDAIVELGRAYREDQREQDD